MNIPQVQPPWSGLGRRLESACRKALYDYTMLEGITKLGIALSGGKDSLTLLFLLKAISGRGFPELNIHAFHVTGEFSCGAGIDQNTLKKVCEGLGVHFTCRESHQKLETLECYSCSRERRRLLFEAAKEHGITTIAFGHHSDDHAQTLLMNLLHKGEFAGNLPKIHMENYGVTIIRPMIYIMEKDIRTFAQQQGFIRIVCRCPVGQHSMRKKTENILKDLETVYPHARENIAKAGLLYGSTKAKTK